MRLGTPPHERLGHRASALTLAVLMALPLQPSLLMATPRNAAVNLLTALTVQEAADTTVITVQGRRAPTFTTFRLERPTRLFVDIAGADVGSLTRSVAVGNGVIRSVEAVPFRRRGATYGRLVVTFLSEALYHVRADGNAVIIVVDGSGRKLSKAETRAIADASTAARSAADRERTLLKTLRTIRSREQEAEKRRADALAAQKRLQAELVALKKSDASRGAAVKELSRRAKQAEQQLQGRDTELARIQKEASSLRNELKRERKSLADAVAQRRAEEARIALLRAQIAKERKAIGSENKSRISTLETSLVKARSQAEALRKQVKQAREVRRTAQAEEVARLKAAVAKRDAALKARMSDAGKRDAANRSELVRLRTTLAKQRGALKAQQTQLTSSRKADAARAVAERRWRQAESRAEAAFKQLAVRTAQLAKARRAMAEISRSEAASRQRASQIAALLARRESELSAARRSLQSREKALKGALAQARAREKSAAQAGRKSEAAAATKQRLHLEQVRAKLATQLTAQNRSLTALQKQAKTNQAARAKAEGEAAKLRKSLAAREDKIARLSKQADRSRAAESKVAALQAEAARLRKGLLAQAGKRDKQLDTIEIELGKRIAAAQKQLVAAQKTNTSLERDLAAARAQAQATRAALTAAEKNAALTQKELSRAKKHAASTEGALARQRELAASNAAELKRAQQGAAKREVELARIRKQAKEAMVRADRVARLLAARETELSSTQRELKRRESVLSKELSRAKSREVAARKAGHASEAAAAAQLRGQLNKERKSLRQRLSVHEVNLRAARAEASRNATARASAEKEALALRTQLKRQNEALAQLRASKGKRVAVDLTAKEHEIKALRERLAKQAKARDARLSGMEKTLNSRLKSSRKALSKAKKDNDALEKQLAAARDREAGQRKHAAAERQRATAERQRAERVGKLLLQRESELKQMQRELAQRQDKLTRQVKIARSREAKARKAGLAGEAKRIADERNSLERELGGLRGDLGRSRTDLAAARAEASRHAKARKSSETRAKSLAKALAAREAELRRLSKAGQANSNSQRRAARDAEARVAKARARLVQAQKERALVQKKFERTLGDRVASVRAEMARQAKKREAALQKSHRVELAAARASAQRAASASEKRSKQVATLLGRRESELNSLRKETAARVDRLQRELAEANAVARLARAAGKKRDVVAAKRRVNRIGAEVRAARKVAAKRERDLTKARAEAAGEQRARQKAEKRAAALNETLRKRADELARLRTDRRASTRRIAEAERAFAESRNKLASANAKLEAEVKRTHNRLQNQIVAVRKKLAAEYTRKERALKKQHATRERALQTALALEQARRRQAESRTRPVAAGTGLTGFSRRHQSRIAILEARASREREARERKDREAKTDKVRLARLERELAVARKKGAGQQNETEIRRRAAAMAAKMVSEAKRREATQEAARRSTEERRRIRQQAAVERTRARQSMDKGKNVARVLDVKITAEGYHRGQVALPLKGMPKYEVMETGGRRAVLRLHGTVLPSHLQRVFDTRELRGPMERVTVFRPQNRPNETHVVVDLVRPASNAVSVRGGRLVWDFVRAQQRHTRAPGPRQFAAGGALGARTPQPRAPRGGAGSPQGAGVNSNPIRTPWRQSRRYSGKRINLTIKDADIRHVLTFLAREGNVNIIAGPEVTGNVTFHLENIPWDLALDVILRARGMDYVRQSGVIRVSTTKMLKKEFDLAVERRKKLQEVKQLVVRIIPVNYGRASDMKSQVTTVLSKSGTVSVNRRTNSILVKDTEEHVAAVEEMIHKLDAQTPQVLVEARIVEASSNFSKDVGIQWGGNYAMSSVYGNETGLAFPSVVGVAGGADGGQTNTDGLKAPIPNYAVNMPAAVGAGSGGAIGLTLGSLGGAGNLNLRLSAAENEGTVKLVSSPKVLTLDNKTATIRQGISIPISVVSAQGVQTRFVNADLRLQVTPHITQDGNILMAIMISKNEPDFSNRAADGNPTITQREAQTELLLGDGETTVIGGIYTRSTSESVKKVPFFGSLPLIGALFRSRSEEDKRTELLIFITPRIVNRAQSMRIGK